MDQRTAKSLAQRIVLRPVNQGDLPTLYQHQSDPIALRMLNFTSRDWPAFVEHWTKIMADTSGISRTILFDGQIAGNVGSFELFGEREIGYWIGREYWGHGIASYAVTELLKLDPTRPIYAHVAKHNSASLRVLEKCGFTMYGVDAGLPNQQGEQLEEFVLELKAAR